MSDDRKKSRRARRMFAAAAVAMGLSPAGGGTAEAGPSICVPPAVRTAYQQLVRTRMQGVLTCLSQSQEVSFDSSETPTDRLRRCARLWGTVEELQTALTVAVATECPASPTMEEDSLPSREETENTLRH